MRDKIDIAIGASAKTKRWKNQSWSWAKLLERLQDPVRTSETHAQYVKANASERALIKDVGGYVGGYLQDGRRQPNKVLHRQLLTLDLDHADSTVWDMFTLEYDCEAYIHATHSHTEAKPKFRLIMPLSEEVSREQYQAIGRRVAGDLGIELFDETGFQAERLMYWPSCSRDVDFYSQHQTGEWLDVDGVLGRYRDWREVSEWPTSKEIKEHLGAEADKQQDPRDKKGLIGAFCRSYSMSEALEVFLSDVYTKRSEDRYTYAHGSTVGGLVTYQDLWAYSHHGTDPTGGKLCNVYDMVRLHKFGYMDEGNSSESVSAKAMNQLVRSDARVKKELVNERKASIGSMFGEPSDDSVAKKIATPIETEDAETDDAWQESLDIDPRGAFVSSAQNITLILKNDPELKGKLALNEFDGKPYCLGPLPWRRVDGVEPWRDVDFAGIRGYLETAYGIVSLGKINDALAVFMEVNKFHPVKDYLESLKWDGHRRLHNILTEYLGVESNEYIRCISRKTFCAAVARIYNPGVKFDYVLTLVGAEGVGKSSLCSVMAGEWFSDSVLSIQGKEAFEQLRGAWIMEIAEMSAFSKADTESVKHYVSKTADTYRPAFGRVVETFKRNNIFIATTNREDFLREGGGNRRFWPATVNPAQAVCNPLEMGEETRGQLWAEAKVLYDAGEALYLPEAIEREARLVQQESTLGDDRAGSVEAYLNTPLPATWDRMTTDARCMYLDDPDDDPLEILKPRTEVSAAEVWAECFRMPMRAYDRRRAAEVNSILRMLPGWERTNRSKMLGTYYGKQRLYVRTPD